MKKIIKELLGLTLVVAFIMVAWMFAGTKSVAGATVEPVKNLSVANYYTLSGKIIIYFDKPEKSSGFNVYVDEVTKPLKTISGSGGYIAASEIPNIYSGSHTIYVTNFIKSGDTITESEKVSTKVGIYGMEGDYGDIPQVYIKSDEITQNYHTNNDIVVTLVDKDGGNFADIIDGECNMKIRGHSTSEQLKKAWNLKFSGKKDVLGMGRGKKWNLLANSMDKSLMRNTLAYNFGRQIGISYTSELRYVEVYLNGVYQGSYQICEAVQAKENRVEIDAYNPNNIDCLLEVTNWERTDAGVDYISTNSLKVRVGVNDPERGEDLTDNQINIKITKIKSFLNNFETALKTYNLKEIAKYADIDSFVNFYIVNEYFKNIDFNNFSTRFYIKNNKIYAGPVWDLDLSSGNFDPTFYRGTYVNGDSSVNYNCRKMPWMNKLFASDGFEDRVKARFAVLQPWIQGMFKKGSTQENSIDQITKKYQKSFIRNYAPIQQRGAGWSLTNDDGLSYAGVSGWKTWSDPIEFLRSWMERRNNWMCAVWEINPNAYDVNPSGQKQTAKKNTAVKVGKSSIKKVKRYKKKVKVTLKKVAKANRYQVKVSLSKSYNKKKTITKTYKKTKLTVKLSKKYRKNKLYIKARAYIINNGKKNYGAWSKTKKIKAKK